MGVFFFLLSFSFLFLCIGFNLSSGLRFKWRSPVLNNGKKTEDRKEERGRLSGKGNLCRGEAQWGKKSAYHCVVTYAIRERVFKCQRRQRNVLPERPVSEN